MLDQNQLDQVIGATAYDSDGGKIGKIGQVYLDNSTGEPAWATVNTGLFGMSESFVPLQEASLSGDGLRVPYDKETVKNAPNIESDGELSPEEESELYRHYSIGESGTTTDDVAYTDSTTTDSTTADSTYTETRDTTGDVDDSMTLSEERVEVGTRTEEAGRARLRKYVVTENVTETVPVTKERAVLEREPITDANRDKAMDGPEITEAEHEVVLHEERPVVQKTTEAVERVRLGTEQVTTEESISEEVRKERAEVEGDVADTTTTDGDVDETTTTESNRSTDL